MKVTYWVAKCLSDSDAYSVRGKTRQAVEKDLMARVGGVGERGPKYDPPKRVTTPDFAGSFDMLEQCLSEGGAWWEDAE